MQKTDEERKYPSVSQVLCTARLSWQYKFTICPHCALFLELRLVRQNKYLRKIQGKFLSVKAK